MDKFVTKVVVWRCTSRRPFRRSVCPPSEGHRFGEKNCNIWNNKQSKEQHHSFGRCWKLKLMENKICIVLGRSGTHTSTRHGSDTVFLQFRIFYRLLLLLVVSRKLFYFEELFSYLFEAVRCGLELKSAGGHIGVEAGSITQETYWQS